MKEHDAAARQDSREKKRVSTLYIVMIALLTAMTTVATLAIQIPVGIGYVNFGDAVVMVSAVVLGPLGAMAAGGLGSALADVFTGYLVYAPFTLVIKALEGLVVGLIFKSVLKNKSCYLRAILAFLTGAAIVVAGYAFADFFLVLVGYISADGGAVGTVALIAGLTTVPATLVQVGVSAAIAMLVAPKLPTLSLLNAAKNRS